MSSLTNYYESGAYFEQLKILSLEHDAGISRDLALNFVLGAKPSGLDILDVGCGLGGFSRPLHGVNRITCADINSQCLEFVSKHWGCPTLQFDLECQWPIGPAAFDLVLMGDVLEHLFASRHVLAQARAVLRPNGRIAVAVPNVGYWRRRSRLLFTGELSKNAGEHIRFFSPDLLARVAGLAGLEATDYRAYAWNRKSRPWLPLRFSWGFVALLRPNIDPPIASGLI
jgi:2-polyprenyl-3-methyl-5-hydroxy-6-metoxy-1,4-benzoquinol methylase